ncbi:hypothetical protein E2C01_018674 [Portunus trituberculatus]|uniref:Uncharacterized protein n=1 Tax=Portunus trituberculatus TaxID=210409 RepID=A0A5B7DX42_PORTR|nr:hypothetical protein [Portunus trituberculatus]
MRRAHSLHTTLRHTVSVVHHTCPVTWQQELFCAPHCHHNTELCTTLCQPASLSHAGTAPASSHGHSATPGHPALRCRPFHAVLVQGWLSMAPGWHPGLPRHAPPCNHLRARAAGILDK